MMEQETDQAPEPLQEVLQNVELHYADLSLFRRTPLSIIG